MSARVIDGKAVAAKLREEYKVRIARMRAERGITPGDVIVSVEGRHVASVGELLGRLDDFAVGDTVKLGVLRDGARRDVEVTLQPGA